MIRAATKKDLEQITAIYNHAVAHSTATFDTEKKSEKYFENFLDDKEYFHYLAVYENSSEIIGFVGLYPFSKRKAYSCMSELTCYVHPDFKSEGVGFKLLEHADNYAKLSKLHTTIALFNSSNIAVEKIIKSLGFNYKGEMEEVAIKFDTLHTLKIYQKIY